MTTKEKIKQHKITPAPIRQVVQVRFPDGRAFDGPVGTTIEEFIEVAQPKSAGVIVAALVNNKFLSYLSLELKLDRYVLYANSPEMEKVHFHSIITLRTSENNQTC